MLTRLSCLDRKATHAFARMKDRDDVLRFWGLYDTKISEEEPAIFSWLIDEIKEKGHSDVLYLRDYLDEDLYDKKAFVLRDGKVYSGWMTEEDQEASEFFEISPYVNIDSPEENTETPDE